VVFVLPLEMNGKDFRQRWKLSRPKRCSVAVCHVQANSGSHHATNTCTIGGNRGRASQSLTLRLQPLMVLMVLIPYQAISYHLYLGYSAE
jgi:hypothetical protein